MSVKRIVITGPESTGKTTLARELASHFRTVWIPEYAREYIGNLERPYTYDDILVIAREQAGRQKQMESNADTYLFCDTGMIVLKIWSEDKFGRCHQWIKDQIREHPADLYILCDIDLPWEKDPLREDPGRREEIFNCYLDTLTLGDLPFVAVSGNSTHRLQNALKAIRLHLPDHA